MPDTFPPDDDTLKTISGTNTPDVSENLSMGWLLTLLLLVLAAGLFFYFDNRPDDSGSVVAPQFIIPSTDTVANKTDTALNKKAPVSPDSTRR